MGKPESNNNNYMCVLHSFVFIFNSRKDTERYFFLEEHNLTIILCIEILYNKRNALNSLICFYVFLLIHPPKVMVKFCFVFSSFGFLLEFRVHLLKQKD